MHLKHIRICITMMMAIQESGETRLIRIAGNHGGCGLKSKRYSLKPPASNPAMNFSKQCTLLLLCLPLRCRGLFLFSIPKPNTTIKLNLSLDPPFGHCLQRYTWIIGGHCRRGVLPKADQRFFKVFPFLSLAIFVVFF